MGNESQSFKKKDIKETKQQKFIIEILSKNYIHSKRIIKESEENIIQCDPEKLRTCYRIVSHIDNVTECLGEREKFIIQKEVMEGRTGKWYMEFLSAPSYYRHRSKAYEDFLHCL